MKRNSLSDFMLELGTVLAPSITGALMVYNVLDGAKVHAAITAGGFVFTLLSAWKAHEYKHGGDNG